MKLGNAVKRFRQRRAVRLGYNTIARYDSVKEYRLRRAERMGFRLDEDGEWKAADEGNEIMPDVVRNEKN